MQENGNGKLYGALAAGFLVLLIACFIGWKVSHQDATGSDSAFVSGASGIDNNGPAKRVFGTNQPGIQADIPPGLRPTRLPEWREKMDDILTAEGPSEEQKAEQLAAMIPGQPPEVQNEAAREMSLILSDTNYAPAAKLLLNPRTPTNVFNQLFQEFVIRGNELKLPIFLDLAQSKDHFYHSNAKEVLKTYLKMDYGDRWDLWQAGVSNYLDMTINGIRAPKQ
jgi:hypothetical protein